MTPAHQPIQSIARKVTRPLAESQPWRAPEIAELVTRIDAALRERRAA